MKKRELKEGIKQMIGEVKRDYPKMTWRLSVFSALASVAFYFGVLQELITNDQGNKDAKIEQLTKDNERLKKHIDLLSAKKDRNE